MVIFLSLFVVFLCNVQTENSNYRTTLKILCQWQTSYSDIETEFYFTYADAYWNSCRPITNLKINRKRNARAQSERRCLRLTTVGLNISLIKDTDSSTTKDIFYY